MALFSRRKPKRLSGTLTGTGDAGSDRGPVLAWQRIAVLLTFVVVVATLTDDIRATPEVVESEVNFDAIAPENVKAEFNFSSVLLDQTEAARKAAEAAVPRMYKVDPVRVQTAIATYDALVAAIDEARDKVAAALPDLAKAAESQETLDARIDELVVSAAGDLRSGNETFGQLTDDGVLRRWLTPNRNAVNDLFSAAQAEEPLPALPPGTFSSFDRLRAAGRSGVTHAARFGILESEDAGSATGDATAPGYVVLREDAPAPDLPASQTLTFGEAPTRENARDRLLQRIGQEFVTDSAPADDPAVTAARADQNAAFAVAELALAPTLYYDAAETAFERDQARQAVEPIVREFRRGEIIQQDGLPWSAQSISDYETMRHILEQGGENSAVGIISELIANALFAALALLCLWRALLIVLPKDQDPSLNLMVGLLVLAAAMVVGRVTMQFEPTGYIVPLMAGSILLAILTNVGLAATYSVLAPALLSVQYGYDWPLFVVHFTMCLGGALSIVRVRRRRDMNNAAIKATAIGLAASVATALAAGTLVTETQFWINEESIRTLLLVALNGVVCLFLVPGLLSPLERMFRITTDIQLLEYSDLNNEVLSRLAIEIPATYSHSLMLGQLAEAACDAIGANGLKARVCAYYHDIGKLRRPEYFYENQTGQNVHEGMPPRLSARAIASHVTEGAEMAREFHLPKPFIDAILEHHGTGLISFFYKLASEEQKHGGVREEDFRYPGPKPQSRETAILMICDASESAVRSLKNPNEDRVHELVSKLVRARLDDRQFDECDITMRELDVVIDIVSSRLAATMHQRLAYPGQQDGDKNAENIVRIAGTQES